MPASTASADQQGEPAASEEGTDGQTPASSAPPTGGSSSSNGGGPPPYMGRGRGRGGPFSGRGRGGGYNPHMNGSGGGSMYGGPHGHHSNSMGGGPGGDHGSMPRRGAPRGRGGYNQGMSRPPLHHHHQAHNSNTQLAPVPALKRGAPGGPGPKRGRYEGGPYSQRPMTPKYHTPQQHMGGGGGGGGSMAPPSSYGSPPSHHAPAQRYVLSSLN